MSTFTLQGGPAVLAPAAGQHHTIRGTTGPGCGSTAIRWCGSCPGDQALFIVFRVVPHSRNIARSLLKEPKLYFYDICMIEDDPGARFENLVAVSLLKHALGKTDELGRRHELRYLRTKEGREVDFCLVQEERPVLMVEARHSGASLSASLLAFHRRHGIKGVQVVRHHKRESRDRGLEVRRARPFLEAL